MKSLFLSGWIVAVTFFLLQKAATASGSPGVTWNKGAMVLEDQQVLRGEFCVQAVYDLVLFRNGKAVNVYPAHTFRSLHVYDQKADINRRYVSHVSAEEGLAVRRIYEVVLYGEISVLRRQKVSTAHSPELSDAFDFNYFIVSKDGTYFLHQFRERVFPGMVEHGGEEISTFIKLNKLDPNRESDAVRLIRFFNKNRSTSLMINGESL